MTTPDPINRAAWSDPTTLAWFERYEGWSDPGERAAVGAIAEEIKDRPVLDIGVGAGRTTALLRELTDDYVGIDYLEPMVELASKKNPDARIELGDARDLGRFEPGSFALVMFSWNGIDAVTHDDRHQVLREVRRVLAPGGAFLFSTHNLDGPGFGQKPWGDLWTLRHPRMIVELATHVPSNLRNYRRNRVHEQAHDGWGMRVAAAHNFGIVIHYTTLDAQRRELAGLGFAADARVFENTSGRELDAHDATTAFWLHLIARAAVG